MKKIGLILKPEILIATSKRSSALSELSERKESRFFNNARKFIKRELADLTILKTRLITKVTTFSIAQKTNSKHLLVNGILMLNRLEINSIEQTSRLMNS